MASVSTFIILIVSLIHLTAAGFVPAVDVSSTDDIAPSSDSAADAAVLTPGQFAKAVLRKLGLPQAVADELEANVYQMGFDFKVGSNFAESVPHWFEDDSGKPKVDFNQVAALLESTQYREIVQDVQELRVR